MQMAISTTGRHPLCILCSVYVLSKMLKHRSAEGSSFRLWWMLSTVLVLRQHLFCLLDTVSRLLLKQHHCACHQTHWWLGSVRLVSETDVLTVMLSILRWGFVRWWACSGSNHLLLRFVFEIAGGYLMKSDVCFWVSSCVDVDTVIWAIEVIVRMFWCLSGATRLQRLMPWCYWALWLSSVLLALRIAKVTLIGSVAA
jgi:hypothetical protein